MDNENVIKVNFKKIDLSIFKKFGQDCKSTFSRTKQRVSEWNESRKEKAELIDSLNGFAGELAEQFSKANSRADMLEIATRLEATAKVLRNVAETI